jgi:hypothetical protein
MNANKHVSKPTWSDPDDAPELTDAWFAQAGLYQGEQLEAPNHEASARASRPCVNPGSFVYTPEAADGAFVSKKS